jgi:hypothetical protein
MNLKGSKARNYVGVIVIIILAYSLFAKYRHGEKNALSENIYGIVSKVEYNVQRHADFIVNGKKYDTYQFIVDNRDVLMEVGDTVIKRKGSTRLEIKKKHK